MKYISTIAELLYVVSIFEKGRVKSSGIWNRKYIKSLKESLEIMSLLTNLLSENKEISKDEMRLLKEFIQKNKGIIFGGEWNINTLFYDKEDFCFLLNDFEDIIKLMKDIIFEIENLMCTKKKNYKIQISYLLRAFHNLPRVFFVPDDERVFNIGVQPITKHEAVEYAFSYLLLKDKIK